jgi:UDP-N-acetylmuramyl pentapeptide phosphotransferase/UDP-N-acetylglucosamine-1-phosphate transferase
MTMFLAALVGAALGCFLIVRYAELHIAVTGDAPDMQPQKFHTAPVPRIGGLGVLLGLLVAGAVGYWRGFSGVFFYWALLLVLLPAFAGGFTEDLTRRVGPAVRLLLTVISGAMAFAWLDARLFRSDVFWLDAGFQYWPISFAATLFAVAGLAHAMNIIDGYNGLAAGVGIMSMLAMGTVCHNVGDTQLALVCFATAGAYSGFLLFNYPGGKIFLGDGGAYLLGTIIAIVSALLVARHSEVSPWFPLALVVYPVWETLFSALRRLLLHHTGIGRPDARHLHSLIHRRVLRVVYLGRDDASLQLRNAATTIPLWVIQAVLVAYAVSNYQSSAALIAESYVFIALYCAVYFWLNRKRRPIPPRLEKYLSLRERRSNPQT